MILSKTFKLILLPFCVLFIAIFIFSLSSFTKDYITYCLNSNMLYLIISPITISYGIYIIYKGGRTNKTPYLLIIGGLYAGYLLFFANPFAAFYTKTDFQNQKFIRCFISTSQFNQISQEIAEYAFSDNVLIYEGEKTIGKSITFQKFASENKNVLYFAINARNPENIFDTLLSKLGDFDYLDMTIPVLKFFGKKKKERNDIQEFFESHPDLVIDSKIPIIIIDNFDFLYNKNEDMAVNFLTSARLLRYKCRFIFVSTEGYLSQSALSHEKRLYFKEFPPLNKVERVEFAKCYLYEKCPYYDHKISSISEYLTASFAINTRFLDALCKYNSTIGSEEDIKLLLQKDSDLRFYLHRSFQEVKLDFFTKNKRLIAKAINKPILEIIFNLIDEDEIDFQSKMIDLDIIKKDVFKIKIHENYYLLTFQTKFHKFVAENYFGNISSQKTEEFMRLLDKNFNIF